MLLKGYDTDIKSKANIFDGDQVIHAWEDGVQLMVGEAGHLHHRLLWGASPDGEPGPRTPVQKW